MSDETPKPKRNRRRWIIVSVLLLAVITAAWWYWPRIDPRLVGAWRISTRDTERFFGPLRLEPDGTGLVVVREKTGEGFVTRTYGFDWRVEGNSFAVLVANKSGFPLWDRAMQHAYLYTKNAIFWGRNRFSVDRSHGDRLQLDGSQEKPQFLPASFSITRVPP